MTDPDRLARSVAPDADLAPFIDHTLLRPEAEPTAFDRLCREAAEHGFAAVCVPSSQVPRCVRLLEGSGVRVASVVGFPLGSSATRAKIAEAREAVDEGAVELDMVLPIGALKARAVDSVEADIRGVVESCAEAAVKVILETALLDDVEKVLAARLAEAAGAAYVKTCTGFGGGGASVHDVRLLRSTVGAEVGIKASGGIRDAATARAMIAAGATRIGTSRGVHLVTSDSGAELGSGPGNPRS